MTSLSNTTPHNINTLTALKSSKSESSLSECIFILSPNVPCAAACSLFMARNLWKKETRQAHYTNRIYGNIGRRWLSLRPPVVYRGPVLRGRGVVRRRRISVMLIKAGITRRRGKYIGEHAGTLSLPIESPRWRGGHRLTPGQIPEKTHV